VCRYAGTTRDHASDAESDSPKPVRNDGQLEIHSLFEEIRAIIKESSKLEDARALIPWLLSHYQDSGAIRGVDWKRPSIVLDGVKYWLVRVPADD
jgi:hypothetical protein